MGLDGSPKPAGEWARTRTKYSVAGRRPSAQ
eukprot:CAMPEP_0206369604 /NCGR_PEP_ID=MMETSP0294-20121207/5402_1 /ASSEMBLY_ACC=CAM_ASM_000327 /TAXON_ID=39354 /ORGANISM="Heterosigma akashiwo, Strain CCMP2393" /LENGTH=30 /DNA_ID= /DNA_START= /DNA_END= /DNA_ORIENTATION=